MNILIFIGFFGFFYFKNAEAISEDVVKDQYWKWKTKYRDSDQESEVPYVIFRQTLMKVAQHELQYFTKRSSYTYKLNGRSADTFSEMALWNGLLVDNSINEAAVIRNKRSINMTGVYNFPPAPSSWDWSEQGYVTDVDDQGYYCGSCYSFATACAMEGQYMKVHKKLRKFSKQQTVDCSRSFGNFGCEGGYLNATFKYIRQNNGITNETIYPYVGVDESCYYNSSMYAGSVSGYDFVYGDEENLKRALYAIGPLAIGMKGDIESFYYYGGGIFDDANCFGAINHAVCLVGYGTDNTTNPPTDYWIAKNSWSTDWGEGGYFKLLRGSNLCNVSKYVVYPTVI